MKLATRISVSLLLVCYFCVASDRASLTSAFAQDDQFNGCRTVQDTDISQAARLIRVFAKSALRDLQEEWSDTDLLQAAPQYSGQVVPFLRLWRLHNAIRGTREGGVLPGTNLGEQVNHLLRLSSCEGKATLSAALENLKSKNMIDAIRLAEAVVRYTSNDEALLNASLLIDILVLALLWLLVRRFRTQLTLSLNTLGGLVRTLATTQPPLLLGAVGLACLFVGFVLADGYIPSLGVLGSLPLMNVSLIVVDVPYRWIVVVSLLLILYATYQFLRVKLAAQQ